MRFKDGNDKFTVYAVTGKNTIAFGIECAEKDMKGLLGFTVEKEYEKENQKIRVTVMGFKVFKDASKTQFLGHSILLTIIQYSPLSGKIFLHTRIRFILTTSLHFMRIL